MSVLEKNMAKRCKIIFFIISLFFVFSCHKPFSINAEYEDIPVVYAVFSLSDSTHYVKVYKSFLTSGDVKNAAQDWRNLSYIDSIDVYVEEYDAKSDELLQVVHFDTTTEIAKDSGYFSYPYQILYKGNLSLQMSCYYKLKIFNPYTHRMVEGTLTAIDTVNLLMPRRNINPPILLSLPLKDMYVKIRPAIDASLYLVQIQYYYTQVNKDSTRQAQEPIIWDLGEIDTREYKTANISPDMFYRNVARHIKDDTNVVRRYTDSIVIEVTAISESMHKYMLAAKPSSSINQEYGNYTNLTSYDVNTNESKLAFGIVGAKSVTRFFYNDLATPGSRDSLIGGVYTKHLRFTDVH